jgi:type IV pilus assembly protein PilW
MKAQYGMDDGISNGSLSHASYTANDGVVDRYVNSLPASWTQVLSIRLGIVARSALMEKADPATGICNITTVAPTWAGGTLDVSADPNWMCYRYKVFETTVPLRNMLWTPQ